MGLRESSAYPSNDILNNVDEAIAGWNKQTPINMAGLVKERCADEVISHFSGLVGAKVTVTLEIAAEVPSGAPDHVVRTVTENSRTLKFTSQGFEKE